MNHIFGNAKRHYEIVFLATGQLLSIIFSLVGIKIFTIYMPPSSYGQFSLLLTIQMAAVQLIYGPIGNACLRFSSDEATKENRNQILHASLLMACAASGVTLFASLAICFWTETRRYQPLGMAVMTAALYSIGFGLIHILGQYFNANRDRAAFSLTGAGLSGCQVVLGLICIKIMGATPNSLLLGYLLASLFVLAGCFAYVRKVYKLDSAYSVNYTELNATLHKRGSIRGKGLINRLYAYGISFSQWGLFTMFYIGSDRWALGLTHGASSVGIYSVAYQLCYAPVAITGGLIMQYISPILFQTKEVLKGTTKTNEKSKQIVAGGIIICLACGILASLVSPFILMIFTNSEYRGPELLGPLLAIAAAIGASAEMIGLLYQKNLKVARLAKIKILAAVLSIGGNLLFANYMGPLGVSISLAAYGLTQISLMLTRKETT